MKKVLYKYWNLIVGCLVIILAHPISLLFSTEVISYSQYGNTYAIDRRLALYLTISFWIVGIILCLFKRINGDEN